MKNEMIKSHQSEKMILKMILRNQYSALYSGQNIR